MIDVVHGESVVRLVTRRLVLRRAVRAELRSLALELSSNAGALPAAPHRGDLDPAWTFDAWRAVRNLLADVASESRLCLSIEERATGMVIGLAELLVPNAPDGMPWIGLLVIENGKRNLGLGSEAVDALERFLTREDWPEVRLNVHRANLGARGFWEQHGFRELRDAWRRYDGLAPQSLTLSKALGPSAQRQGRATDGSGARVGGVSL